MHIIDIAIFVLYLIGMVGVGVYFFRQNTSREDYYVGGRSMTSGHIGLSVVATDVGGGFSIGLGGLGFSIGLSGSWMLFTGLVGAWLSAAFLIPKVYPLAKKHNFLTFPEALRHHYGSAVAIAAAIISFIGYIGFTGSQLLAGAKLASATFPEISIVEATLWMGVLAVGYTVVGGIKAVIYTDTIQWIILMVGLIGVGLPISYHAVGGWEAISSTVAPEMLTLTHITFFDLFNWALTIIPIWFVGMTLYQRIYACKDERTAKRAWYIAGLFEWPVMAFMGVLLGLLANVAYQQGLFEAAGYSATTPLDAELGLPLLLVQVLPAGLMGLMMAAYFSAVLSTADSCLMAASGNLTSDLLPFLNTKRSLSEMSLSQIGTLAVGVVAVVLAASLENVLSLMLYSYAFMVSGLLVPVVASLIIKKAAPAAALTAMVCGSATTLWLIFSGIDSSSALDANFWGISVSAGSFAIVQAISQSKLKTKN